jgi:hypothetical protein
LQKAAGEQNFEQGVCIFKEFKGRACVDEFVRERFEISWWDGFEVLVELISEDCRSPAKFADRRVDGETEWSQISKLDRDTERGFLDLLACWFVFGLSFDSAFSRFDSYPL